MEIEQQITRLKELASAVENEYIGTALLLAAETIQQQGATIVTQREIIQNAIVANCRLEADTIKAAKAARSARAQHGLLLRELSDFGDHLAELTGQSYGGEEYKKIVAIGLRKGG
jgi:hypothetical protein